jgi:hypothetical protein
MDYALCYATDEEMGNTMKFAKLFDTCEKHQILVTIMRENELWGLALETWIEELGLVHTHFGFEDIADVKEAFEQCTAKMAKRIIADTILELQEEAEVVH